MRILKPRAQPGRIHCDLTPHQYQLLIGLIWSSKRLRPYITLLTIFGRQTSFSAFRSNSLRQFYRFIQLDRLGGRDEGEG